MGMAKRKLRQLPVTGEIAKLARELGSVHSRLVNRLASIQDVEIDARTLRNRRDGGQEDLEAVGPHDPANCTKLACRRCDDYGAGYAAGKEKAHAETRQWEPDGHLQGCGCEPCRTARAVLEAAAAG